MIAHFSRCEQRRIAKTPVRRLFVDISNIARSDARTGIQRVVRAIFVGLADLPDSVTLCPIYVSSKRGLREIKLNGAQGSLTRRLLSRRVRPRAGDIFLALDLNAHMLPRYEQQLVTWRSAGVKIFFVVYDLLPDHHPEWFTDKAVASFRQWLTVICRTADEIICISSSVSDQVKRWLTDGAIPDSKRVSVVRLGTNIAESLPSAGFSPTAKQVISSISNSRFVLMVGTIEPRKGYDIALAAFERLWSQHGAQSFSLVIVGRKGWKTEELQSRIRNHPALGVSLFWIEDASDEALEWLYARTAGLFMASRDEGYGLPLAEARGHGIPILARDIPIFREVAGNKAFFFSSDDPDALAIDIARWLDSLNDGVKVLQEKLPTWADTRRDLWIVMGFADH